MARPAPLPADVKAALRAAGSAALPPGARAELDRRVRTHGYDAERRNIGGIRSGARGAGNAMATFPDVATAARRLVQLCRLAAGADHADAAQGYDPDVGHLDMGAFVSLAPEAGAEGKPTIHWSKLMPGDRSGDPGTPGYEMGAAGLDLAAWLAERIGGEPAEASELISYYRSATPAEVATFPAELSARLSATERPADEGTIGDIIGALGAARGSARSAPRPSSYHVIAARQGHHQRRLPRRYQPPQGEECADEALAELDAQAAAEDAAEFGAAGSLPMLPAGPVAGPSGEAAPGDGADLAAADLAAVEGIWSRIWGNAPAADAAFQDLTASWIALKRVPGVERVPGWRGNVAAWDEFARAYRAGDTSSPQCNGDCSAGLNAQIVTLQTMRGELAKLDPNWIKTIPAQISLAAAKGGAFRAAEKVDAAAAAAERNVPGVSWWFRLWSGRLPGWQYGAIAVGGAAVAIGVAKVALPALRRSA